MKASSPPMTGSNKEQPLYAEISKRVQAMPDLRGPETNQTGHEDTLFRAALDLNRGEWKEDDGLVPMAFPYLLQARTNNYNQTATKSPIINYKMSNLMQNCLQFCGCNLRNKLKRKKTAGILFLSRIVLLGMLYEASTILCNVTRTDSANDLNENSDEDYDR